MKKLFAILLACMMIFGLVACASQNAPGDSKNTGTSSEPFKYGFVSWGTADEHGRTLNGALEWAVKAAGGEIVSATDGFSPEGQIAAVENLISAGCNMISFCTYCGESVVPTISDLCRENGVYWTMWDTTISDPEIQAYLNEDPYYVGSTSEDNLAAGYNTMKILGQKGATNVVIVRYGSNIPTCDDRCTGAMNYINEAGNINVVEDIIVTEDYKSAISNVLIAHPETDCVFMAGAGTYCASVAEVFKEKNIDNYYIGTFDYFDSMGDMLKNEELRVINGGHMITSTFSALAAINAYWGTPLTSDKINITIPYLTLDSYEDYEAYIQYASQGAAFTDEEMKQYLTAYNSSLTFDSFREGVAKWSVDDIIARKNS